MTWTKILKLCEELQEAVEVQMGNGTNVGHYAYTRLNRALADANEILEAFAKDEEKP